MNGVMLISLIAPDRLPRLRPRRLPPAAWMDATMDLRQAARAKRSSICRDRIAENSSAKASSRD
jgi:hypothetical protein